MERIQALIDKLYTQKQESASPAQLLFTVQLLHSELQQLQGSQTLGTSKVAVTLPSRMALTTPVAAPVAESRPAPRPEPVAVVAEPVRPVAEPVKPEPPQYEAYMPKPAPQPEPPASVPPVPTYNEINRSSYTLRKPPVVEAEPARTARPVINPAFEVAEEPVLVSASEPKEVFELAPEPREVNELVAAKSVSLNDRLKQERNELAHALKQTPIKDLRKGIGINDRFAFVNELFRGDEAMYERSIKTINSFNIYSEAEYWINRELKFKLGWVDNKETVQHFYQLVRRRFA